MRRSVPPFLLAIALSVSAVLLGSLVALGSPLSPLRAAFADVLTYLQTFTGAPPAPQPWHIADWDVVIHSRDSNTWKSPDPMMAMHGADCSAPPAMHRVSTHDDEVFQCKDHVMTAIYAQGYGVIYLTPNELADFSGGEVRISFDVSTLRTSDRDFLDFWITPYDENLTLPLDNWLPDLNGEPRDAVHIRMNQFHPPDGSRQTVFGANVVRNFAVEDVPGNWWQGYESFLTPSATVRSTVEIRLSRTHLKVGMPQYNFWWVDSDIAPLTWSQGVVQLGHHSYNPSKNSPVNADGSLMYTPDTWHWDNFSLSAAVPFTIIRGDQWFADATTDGKITFPSAAPANAHLRFAGIGNNLKVSYDGGATWQDPQLQAQQLKGKDELFRSYWTPVPVGVTSVQFSGEGGWWGGWMINDASIWAPGSGPTAAPLDAPVALVTPSPAFPSQPVATPVASLQPDGGATATPSAVPSSFTLTARVDSATLPAGGTENVIASVASTAAVTGLVDVEVYDPAGTKVCQQFMDQESLDPVKVRAYVVACQLPADATPGTYTVKIGVFSPGWGTLYVWNDAAARFSVMAAPSPETPAATVVTSPPPTATSLSPSATAAPPAPTAVPPTAVPPTAVPPTATSLPPTATPALQQPPASTPTAATVSTEVPSNGNGPRGTPARGGHGAHGGQ